MSSAVWISFLRNKFKDLPAAEVESAVTQELSSAKEKVHAQIRAWHTGSKGHYDDVVDDYFVCIPRDFWGTSKTNPVPFYPTSMDREGIQLASMVAPP